MATKKGPRPSERARLWKIAITELEAREDEGSLNKFDEKALATLRESGTADPVAGRKGLPPGPIESVSGGFANLRSDLQSLLMIPQGATKQERVTQARTAAENKALFEKGQRAIPSRTGRGISQALQLAGEFGPGVGAGFGIGSLAPKAAASAFPATTRAATKIGIPAVTGAAAGGIQSPGPDVIEEGLLPEMVHRASGAIPGAIVGPVIPPLARAAGRHLPSVGRPIRAATDFLSQTLSKTPGTGRKAFFDKQERAVRNILDRRGLTRSDPNIIRSKIQQRIQRNEPTDANAIAREIEQETRGLIPTRASVTGERGDFLAERALRRGDDPRLAAVEADNIDTLNRSVRNVADEFKVQRATKFEAGSDFKRAIEAVDQRLGQETSDAFNKSRAITGHHDSLSKDGTQLFTEKATNILERAGPSFSKSLRKELKKLTADGGDLSPADANRVLNIIRDEGAKAKGQTGVLFGELRDLTKAALKADGSEASKGVLKAWEKAAERQTSKNSAKAVKAALSPSFNADRFVKTHIISGPTDQVQALQQFARRLPKKEARQVELAIDKSKSVLAQTIAKKMDPKGTGQFNKVAIRDFMNETVGIEKMRNLLGDGAVDELNAILNASDQLTFRGALPQAGAPVTQQNFFEATMNVLQRVAGFGFPARGAQVASRQLRGLGSRASQQRATEQAINLLPEVPFASTANLGAAGATAPAAIEGTIESGQGVAGAAVDFFNAEDAQEKLGILLGRRKQ